MSAEKRMPRIGEAISPMSSTKADTEAKCITYVARIAPA
jgi:hypothetical protein